MDFITAEQLSFNDNTKNFIHNRFHRICKSGITFFSMVSSTLAFF